MAFIEPKARARVRSLARALTQSLVIGLVACVVSWHSASDGHPGAGPVRHAVPVLQLARRADGAPGICARLTLSFPSGIARTQAEQTRRVFAEDAAWLPPVLAHAAQKSAAHPSCGAARTTPEARGRITRIAAARVSRPPRSGAHRRRPQVRPLLQGRGSPVRAHSRGRTPAGRLALLL
jgi:hypothetical protein